jgi:predicted enzyme related to lactoylglutathione lyase
MTPTLGNGKICYVEMPASDIQRSAEFYTKVFGWQTSAAMARSPSMMAWAR